MKRLPWILLPALMSVVLPASADPGPSPSNAPMAQRQEQRRSRLLRERVGLSDEKARKVETILDKYAPERKKLAGALRESRQKLRALIVLNSEDQPAYRAALEVVRTNRKALADLMDRAFAEVSRELTPKEQAKLFFVIERLRGPGARFERFRAGPQVAP